MARPNNSLGFTLIEVLLSMALLMLLMLTAGLVYDYVNQNWQRQQSRFQSQLDDHMVWSTVSKVVRNTYPKLVYDESPYTYFGNRAVPPYGFYFLGRDNGFTGVSYVSVQRPGSPAVFRLFREPDPEQSGLWQLVYEEALIDEVGLYVARQTLDFNYRTVLRSQLDTLEFSYFGYETEANRTRAAARSLFSTPAAEDLPKWMPAHDGLASREHPQRLQITLNEEQLIWILQDSVLAIRGRMEAR